MRQVNILSRRCPSPGNTRGSIAPLVILGFKIQNLPPVIEPYTEISCQPKPYYPPGYVLYFRNCCIRTTGVVKEPQASAAESVVWMQQNPLFFSFSKFKIMPTQIDMSLERYYNSDMLVNNDDPVITQDTLVLYTYDRVLYTSNTVKDPST